MSHIESAATDRQLKELSIAPELFRCGRTRLRFENFVSSPFYFDKSEERVAAVHGKEGQIWSKHEARRLGSCSQHGQRHRVLRRPCCRFSCYSRSDKEGVLFEGPEGMPSV